MKEESSPQEIRRFWEEGNQERNYLNLVDFIGEYSISSVSPDIDNVADKIDYDREQALKAEKEEEERLDALTDQKGIKKWQKKVSDSSLSIPGKKTNPSGLQQEEPKALQ